ncbi:MAG: hypothetical protein P0S96_01160 [Simkaniaceae bacterium]|nr:hypothetical protein [Candidatus Sacchlamyda saccharinae]
MKNESRINEIKDDLKQILSSNLSNLQLFEKCRSICSNRYYTNLDILDDSFLIFINIDSDLDQYPTNLPAFALSNRYLQESKQQIELYVEESKSEIMRSSRALLKKLEKQK